MRRAQSIPYAFAVETLKFAAHTRYTVVVALRLILVVPVGKPTTGDPPVVILPAKVTNAPLAGGLGTVPETVLMPAVNMVAFVVPASVKIAVPPTSQSPAVRDMDVIFAAVFVVRLIAEPEANVELIYSPIFPADALSLVVVPGNCPVAAVAYDVRPEISDAAGCVAEGTPDVEMVLIHLLATVASDCTPPSVEEVGFGSLAAPSVPEEILLALVASVVAEVANGSPLVFVTVSAPVLERVASPLTATSVAAFELLPTKIWVLVKAIGVTTLFKLPFVFKHAHPCPSS